MRGSMVVLVMATYLRLFSPSTGSPPPAAVHPGGVMCDQAAHPIQQRPNFGIEGRVVSIAAQVELQEVTDRAPYSRQPCNKESFKREEPVSPNDIQEKAGVLLTAGMPNQRFEIARGLVGRSQETLQGHTSIR